MLTLKNFELSVAIKENGETDYDTVFSDTVKFAAKDSRAYPIPMFDERDTIEVLDLYTSDELTPSRKVRVIADKLCDALDIAHFDFMIPTKNIRNKVPTKDVTLNMSGYFEQKRVGKKQTNYAWVGKRFSLDSYEMTSEHEGSVDVPCTASGQLKPFRTIDVRDVWHFMREGITSAVADEYHADRRHVRVKLAYVGSVDVQG